MFNPEDFLNQTGDQAMDTKVTPPPVGEYRASADKVEIKTWQKRDDPSVHGLKLVIQWSIDDHAVLALLDREKVTVRQDIMLDVTEQNGLDYGKGKNVTLGRVREAVGLNTPGQPFAPSMIQGRQAKIKVGHRVDGEDIYAEVKGTAKLV